MRDPLQRMVPPPALHGELADFLLGLRAVLHRARAELLSDDNSDAVSNEPPTEVSDEFLDLVMGLASFHRRAERLLALLTRDGARPADAPAPVAHPSPVPWILR